MIKNIFLPEVINNYYLFSQKIISINFGKTLITATYSKISGKKLKVIKNWSEKIDLKVEDGNKNIVAALNALLKNSPNVNKIICGIPSSLTIFKELKLPLTSRESIKLVLKNEISKSLPFKIEDANIDFIETKKEKKSTKLIAVTTQKNDTQYIDTLFKEANHKLSTIIPDAIGAYSFLKSNNYLSSESDIAVGINYSYITVYYIKNKELKNVRTIPKGINDLLKNANESEVEKIYNSRSIEISEKKEAIDQFISDVIFTSNAIAEEDSYNLILLPSEIHLKGIADYLEKKINKKITDLSNIKNLYSIGLAYSILDYPFFNLLSEEFNRKIAKNIAIKLIIGLVLIISIVSTLFVNNFIKLNNLNKYLKKEQNLLKTNINNNFKSKIKGSTEPKKANINKIRQEINKEKSIWMPYSSKNKYLYLNLLKELTKLINPKSDEIKIEELKFNPNFISLKAQAKDFDSLIKFEKEMEESSTFKLESKPQTTDFDIKILYDLDGE